MGFAERLKELLSKRQVGKRDVVSATGISKSTYYRYIAGESEPTVAALLVLADYFNVSLDYLVGRSNTPARVP